MCVQTFLISFGRCVAFSLMTSEGTFTHYLRAYDQVFHFIDSNCLTSFTYPF
jgi:hypothetical protein